MSDHVDEDAVDDFITDFVAETMEMLDSLEPDVMLLEKVSGSAAKDIINRVFRIIHSIKGGAGFTGLEPLKQLSQAMEGIIIRVREKQLSLDPATIDVLLAGVDKIRQIIADVHNSDIIPYEVELEALKKIASPERMTSLAETGKVDCQAVGAEPLREAVPVVETDSRNIADDLMTDDFINDIKELLDSVEPDFLLMEKERENVSPELINRMFRTMHNIKGGSGFCGFNALKELSHAMENVLMLVREGTMRLDPGKMDVLLAGVDKIRQMVDQIEYSDQIPFDQELGQLNAMLSRGGEVGVPRVADSDDEGAAESEVEAAKGYELWSDHQSSTAPAAKAPVAKAPVVKQIEKKSHSACHGRNLAETIRIPVDLVDRLMNLAGELVLGRNQLRQAIDPYLSDDPRINPIIQNIDVVTSELQENIVNMRMQPIGNVLNKFPRTVRDLSRQINKQAEMVIEGGEVELDKTILESLSNPLTHLVRNCVDHGIETSEVRIGLGKSAVGRIFLRAYHEGGHVNILLKDDGRGINLDKLTQIAIRKKLVTSEQIQRMGEKERLSLVFLPGLSTADEVTEISGRGVGMDVVKTNIERIGGHIDIESEADLGTSIHIVIPLTLAIIPCLIVGVGIQRFAIPQINVQELVCVKASETIHKIEKIGESNVLKVRGRLLPIMRLSEVMGITRVFEHPRTGEKGADRRLRVVDRRAEKMTIAEREKAIEEDLRKNSDRRQSWRSDIYVVVLKVGANVFGLGVDELYDNEEIVVKPLSDHVKSCKIFAGATIMGDGRVAMILDAAGIAVQSRLRFNEIKSEERRRKSLYKADQNSQATQQQHSVIIFNYSPNEFFALPLANISRLEIITPQSIKLIGELEFISYRGDGLPLIRLEKILPVSPLPEGLTELFVIIPKTTTPPVGFIVSRLLDTIDIVIATSQHPTAARGFAGSTVSQGNLIFFLDIAELLKLFDERIQSISPVRLFSLETLNMQENSSDKKAFHG